MMAKNHKPLRMCHDNYFTSFLLVEMMQGHDVELHLINFSLKENFIFLNFKFDAFDNHIEMKKWTKNLSHIGRNVCCFSIFSDYIR
jgi:hypothetical protein